MLQDGEIPTDLGWMILFLIPKGNTDIRVISLLETLWRVVEAIIDTCLRASISFHNVLHGFRALRGIGTAILELKISQELDSVDQDPLFLVFLDLRKSYDTVDRGRILTALEGYGAGPHIRGLLEEFW